MNIHGVKVYGVQMDSQTRCRHYHSPIDIIAIRFACCDAYYPCYECHEEVGCHSAARWGKHQRDEKAILCGACGYQLTIHEYMTCGSLCPACKTAFNPGCQNHYHLYFEM
ncbi:CHY zinc finger protein [Bacillus sp. FJAT-27264]|uniref:CHY zinc finger protein n=1 Tax=Paenibacillus sp. (strain DSM 101736 / FJAT-27264) TaxID=1850362 RepID=UPI0009F1C30B|nr:CHY zinc finger protein [Bacillus sp. FJAT-27264]